MLTLLNLSIILLLLVMVAIWATYGFFSAFIHLVIVIAAGVIAFALWEPIAHMLLGTKFVQHAHGLGLLIPFAVLVVVLRVVFDKVCRANVHMPRIVDQIGGGACGFCSGVLAFGLLLNGANFLPMHREVMGWEPYKVQGNLVNDNPEGKLWGFTSIHKWSAGFFTMVSNGSMSPTGGTPLAVGRPDLAERALLSRLPADENQMRSAHPGSVEVTGVYAIPASEEAIYGLAERSAVFAFLNPGYKVPENIVQDEAGMGVVNAIMADLESRFQAPEANGKAADLLNFEAILAVSQTPQFKFQNPTSREGFPLFVKMVADKMGQDLVSRLQGVMGKGKVLYVVDTAWNNEYAGTFNSDAKLRVAISQVRLQAGEEMIAPIGYSIEYNQNTGGRIFNEIISDESDIALRDAAYSKYTELGMGWVFPLSDSQTPERFFVRELRFDLSKLDKVEGTESKVNQNIGSVAQVVGAPLLPNPDDLADENDPKNNRLPDGVKIVGTNTYADVSEMLPGSFAAAASSLELDKNADPWLLKSGSADKVIPGRGGNKSSVSRIWVQSTDRLVRLTLDGQKAKSLLGRAIGVAEDLNVMRVKDEAGNSYDALGYALLRSDRSLQIDIRDDAINRGLSASELPDVRAGETLMVYFQVPVGTKLTSYVLGDRVQRFEDTLVVTKAD